MSCPSVLRRLTCSPYITRTVRAFTSAIPRPTRSEIVGVTEVPVTAYTEGVDQPYHAVLKVDQSARADATGPVDDAAKVAFAIEKDIASKLPPTLKKFMLDRKVAVVTG